jgi:8-oxo-dGTP diphosphatase
LNSIANTVTPPLPEVCVCYLLRDGDLGPEVLLGEKKTGLGLGKFVGPGGKLERGESPEEAIIREVREEVGLELARASLQGIGELEYVFPHKTSWSQKSWVFLCRDWSGVPNESRELRPSWFRLADIPFDRMWDDAKFWLPTALAGEKVTANFVFNEDNDTVASWSQSSSAR